MDITELVFIDDTGYHFSAYPEFLTWIQDQYRTIYGADIYLEADSQDGQFLAILAKAFYDTAALGASVYNSFSPVTAQGIGLSRNVKINGLTRQVPSFSTVTLTVVGVEGTIITNGVATDNLQIKWLLSSPVVIPNTGTINVTATAELVGAVNAESNTITTIFTPTLGWQTVNNAAAATPGAAVESDALLRIRQAQSTANPSLTVFEGTVGAVENVMGVTKAKGYENDTGSTDGNSIPGHSISVVVAGGDNTDVANAIEVHKTPGCGTHGDTTVLVYDSHGMPINISFQRAVTATIHVEITISTNQTWSSSYETLIQNAIAGVINASDIGGSILISKLYAPAYLFGTVPGQSYDVSLIEIAKNSDPIAGSDINLAWDENPVCDPTTDITVIIT